MKCPNCNYALEDSDICPNCEIDTVLLSKTTLASARLYNKSIQQIKVKDLSGAIDSLLKSIKFNKMNTHSRNLLGVVYFEIGMIGEALKHWVISANYQKENNLAHEYITRLQNNTSTLEQLNSAIKMYNQAVVYLEQDSDDLAIIQLKKATENNPKFLKVQNLLAVVYLAQGENKKALSVLEKILSIDATNELAQGYLKMINTNSDASLERNISKKERTSDNNRSYKPPTKVREKSLSEKFYLTEIATLVTAIMFTIVVFQILIIPPMTAALNEEIVQSNRTMQEYQRILAERDIYLYNIQQEVERLNLLNAEFEQDLDFYARMIQVNIVVQYMHENRYEDALDMLDSIQTYGFGPGLLQTMDRLREEILLLL